MAGGSARLTAILEAWTTIEHSNKIVLGSVHDPQLWRILASDWLGDRRNNSGLGRQLVADLSHRSFLSASEAAMRNRKASLPTTRP